MAPHSSTLAWKILWMEEPVGLQSMAESSCYAMFNIFICIFVWDAQPYELGASGTISPLEGWED